MTSLETAVAALEGAKITLAKDTEALQRGRAILAESEQELASLSVAEDAYVMALGRAIAQGKPLPEVPTSDRHVKRAAASEKRDAARIVIGQLESAHREATQAVELAEVRLNEALADRLASEADALAIDLLRDIEQLQHRLVALHALTLRRAGSAEVLHTRNTNAALAAHIMLPDDDGSQLLQHQERAFTEINSVVARWRAGDLHAAFIVPAAVAVAA
jgi:hypothetical protein